MTMQPIQIADNHRKATQEAEAEHDGLPTLLEELHSEASLAQVRALRSALVGNLADASETVKWAQAIGIKAVRVALATVNARLDTVDKGLRVPPSKAPKTMGEALAALEHLNVILDLVCRTMDNGKFELPKAKQATGPAKKTLRGSGKPTKK